MPKSSTSFGGTFKGDCPSCKSPEAKGKTKCSCGAQSRLNGTAGFKKDPSKEPGKAVENNPYTPVEESVKKGEEKNAVKKPIKSRPKPVQVPEESRSLTPSIQISEMVETTGLKTSHSGDGKSRLEELLKQADQVDQPQQKPGEATTKEVPGNLSPVEDKLTPKLAGLAALCTVGLASWINSKRGFETLPASQDQEDTIKEGWIEVIGPNLPDLIKNHPGWFMIAVGFGAVLFGNAKPLEPIKKPIQENQKPGSEATVTVVP